MIPKKRHVVDKKGLDSFSRQSNPKNEALRATRIDNCMKTLLLVWVDYKVKGGEMMPLIST